MKPSQTDIVLYHNPRCSKSRAALALLREHGVTPRVVEYLQDPLDRAQLCNLIGLLRIKPVELVRTGEEIYKSRYKGKALSDAEWIDALVQHPILMERPIAVRGEHAVIGRPPQRVLELL